jgi:hypothetical protein
VYIYVYMGIYIYICMYHDILRSFSAVDSSHVQLVFLPRILWQVSGFMQIFWAASKSLVLLPPYCDAPEISNLFGSQVRPFTNYKSVISQL